MAQIIRKVNARLNIVSRYEIGRIDKQVPKPSWTYQWAFPGSENPSDPDPTAVFVGPSNTKVANIEWLKEGEYLLHCLVTTDEGCAANVYMSVLVSDTASSLVTLIGATPSCTKQGIDYVYSASADGCTEVGWQAVGGKFKTPSGDYVVGPYTSPVGGGSSVVTVKWDTGVHGNQTLSATGKNGLSQFASTDVKPIKPIPIDPSIEVIANPQVIIGPSPKVETVTIRLTNLQDYPSTFKIGIRLFIGEKLTEVGATTDADFGGSYWPFGGATYISYPVSETLIGNLTEYTATHSVNIPGTYTPGVTPLRYRFRVAVTIESEDGTCISTGSTNGVDLQLVTCPITVATGDPIINAPGCPTVITPGFVNLAKPQGPLTMALGPVSLCNSGPCRFLGTPCFGICQGVTPTFTGVPCFGICTYGAAGFYSIPCFSVVTCPAITAQFAYSLCHSKATVSNASTGYTPYTD